MKLHKPYNSYNLYFTLERTLLVEARKGRPDTSSSIEICLPSFLKPSPNAPTVAPTGYQSIDLPPLPPRYQHLKSILPANWYVPGKNKLVKRKHSRTHGVVSFKEIAKHVATNWRLVDPITKEYVETVAILLKGRHAEIKSALDKKVEELQLHPSFERQRATSSLDMVSLRVSASKDEHVNGTPSSAQTIELDDSCLTPGQDDLNFMLMRGVCQDIDTSDTNIQNNYVVSEQVPNIGSCLMPEKGDLKSMLMCGVCQEIDTSDTNIQKQIPYILDRGGGGGGFTLGQDILNGQHNGNDLHQRDDFEFRVSQEVDMSDGEIINCYHVS